MPSKSTYLFTQWNIITPSFIRVYDDKEWLDLKILWEGSFAEIPLKRTIRWRKTVYAAGYRTRPAGTESGSLVLTNLPDCQRVAVYSAPKISYRI